MRGVTELHAASDLRRASMNDTWPSAEVLEFAVQARTCVYMARIPSRDCRRFAGVGKGIRIGRRSHTLNYKVIARYFIRRGDRHMLNLTISIFWSDAADLEL